MRTTRLALAVLVTSSCLSAPKPAESSDDASTATADALPRDASPTTDTGNGNDAAPTSVVHIAAGDNHACALLDNGAVRCWGEGQWGRLGYGNEDNVGDSMTPAMAGDVDVGGPVMQLVAGAAHTCALLTTGKVRCWGRNTLGQLGHGMGDAFHVGDTEAPSAVGDVPIGDDVLQLSAGWVHTCAVTTNHDVKCWGYNGSGQLGLPGASIIGDFETPESQSPVNLGGAKVDQVSSGREHTCVRLTTGAVRCWGNGGDGRLGYGNADPQTDPSMVGDISIGSPGTAIDVAVGAQHSCVVLTGGVVRCWGNGLLGRLGNLSTSNVGETNFPSEGGTVTTGGTTTTVVAGDAHTCALLSNKELRCWGQESNGALGYGNGVDYGATTAPTVKVPVGGDVEQVVAGELFNCARLSTGRVRCWGLSLNGELGYGNMDQVGRTNTPENVGDVPIF